MNDLEYRMKSKILLVEDEIIVARDIQDRLESLGYAVVGIAVSGQEAIGYAEKYRPDLILMDIRLQGEMDGIQAADHIRKRFDIPVIFLTSYSDNGIVRRAKVSEPFGYLLKPIFEDGELRAGIEVALYKSRMEKEFLMAKKFEAAGIIAGGISHDFNNMLFAITGNIELAMDDIDKSSRGFRCLDQALKTCMAMSRLIHQLLFCSRGSDLTKISVSVADLLHQEADTLLSAFAQKICCEYRFSENLPKIGIDSEQMRRAFRSLISNAIEAIPDGGKIEIGADSIRTDEDMQIHGVLLEKGQYVRIFISDSGIGISEEDISRIFDPYFSRKQRGPQKGMGLGLTLAYAIIHSHHGKIAVESQKGKGTTFHIYLPIISE